MSARLMSARADIKTLIARAEKGDRAAALELADTYRCDSVSELLGVVCPLGVPQVAVFDVCADAMALRRELEARRAGLKSK